MKKVWLLAAAAAVLMTATACGAGDVGGPSSSGAASSQASSQAPSMDQSGVEDNLQGLEKYLAGNGVLSGDPAEMRADVIGAKSGARYQFAFNGKNNVTVELYEYDPASLNSVAQQVIGSVKSAGRFELMGQQIPAVLSDSGKYLMIYKDTVSEDENKARTEQTETLFKQFKQ